MAHPPERRQGGRDAPGSGAARIAAVRHGAAPFLMSESIFSSNRPSSTGFVS